MSPSVQLDPPPAAERERARLHEREGRRPAAGAGDVSLRQWHQTEPEETLRALGASREGLTAAEAEDRLAAHGPNIIAEARRGGPLRILLAQLADFMILVLLAAAFVSGLIGEFEDALAIVAVVVMNALIGFVQEYRADRAVAALRAMAAPSARVVRSRAVATIPAAEVVPGDLVLLEAGGVVPTDLRLLEAARLKVDESALTGESVPVEKTLAPLPEADLTVGDRTNMAYKGTLVTYGRGAGVAVATGGLTELGRIASLLSEAPEVKTPLQRRLAQLGRRVAVAALAICGVVFAAGLLRGEPPMLMFLTAVSLAVAAIPEALPAVVTIALALGARKMARQKALVRKLPAVETLGSVTYVCADKTGTLTLNRMRVEELYCAGRRAAVARGEGPWGELLRAMALCNDATLDPAGRIAGDPTEAALLAAVRQAGLERAEAERDFPRVGEVPFDSARRRMTTVHRDPAAGYVSFTKGAVEVILDRSVDMLSSSGPRPIRKEALLATGEGMAAEGLRVLAFAMRRWAGPPPEGEEAERGLTLLGFAGLMDPPREEVREAVATCRRAGIVPVMITGDHPATAAAVARRLGILGAGEEVMTGVELAALGPGELASRVKRTRVYARVAPEQKLRIVEALQAVGEIVAMTGDGVNDAPALRRADIGVAMGVSGGDVAREASSMILLDDNFATIVRAVREGRRIYDNVRRFTRYIVATNSAEIWTIFLAPLLGLPIPLLPIHILWVNLVTDSLPGLALAAEPAERGAMRRPPRPPNETVFARGLGVHVLWVGALMAALALGVQGFAIHGGWAHWQTMVFTVLCLTQLAHALAIRSERESLLAQGLLSNTPLLAVVAGTVLLQLLAISSPALNRFLKTTPLAPAELAVALAVSTLVFFAVEAEKWALRRGERRREGRAS